MEGRGTTEFCTHYQTLHIPASLAAIAFFNEFLGWNRQKYRESRTDKKDHNHESLYVGKVPHQATEDNLTEWFGQAGFRVTKVSLIHDLLLGVPQLWLH